MGLLLSLQHDGITIVMVTSSEANRRFVQRVTVMKEGEISDKMGSGVRQDVGKNAQFP